MYDELVPRIGLLIISFCCMYGYFFFRNKICQGRSKNACLFLKFILIAVGVLSLIYVFRAFKDYPAAWLVLSVFSFIIIFFAGVVRNCIRLLELWRHKQLSPAIQKGICGFLAFAMIAVIAVVATQKWLSFTTATTYFRNGIVVLVFIDLFLGLLIYVVKRRK